MRSAANTAKKLSVKYQIILLLIVLCLFPFLGLLLYTVHDSVGAIHRQVQSQETEYLDKTRMQLESYKESAEAYFTSKAVKDVFFHYCYNDLNYREYTSLKSAQGELENFSYGQDILGKAYFINFKYSYIIGSNFAGHYLESSGGSNPVLDQVQLAMDDHQATKWVWLAPWEGFQREGKYGSVPIDGNILLIPYPIFNADSDSVLLVQMDSRKAREFLGRTDDPASTLLIANEDDTIIYSADSEQLGKPISDFPYLSSLDRTLTAGVTQMEKDGRAAYLTWIRDDGGWIYCSINNTLAIDQKVNAIRSTFLIFGGGAILILLIVIYLFSVWLYRPIETIAGKMRLLIRDVTGKNEFQIIEKGCEQYEEQMEIYRNSLKEFFLHKLLKSTLSSGDIDKEVRRTGLPASTTEMAVLVFQVLDIENTTPNPDMLAVQKIYTTLSLDFLVAGTYYQGLYVVWLQNRRHDPRFAETIRNECRQLKQEMSMEAYLFALGQSPLFHEYAELHAAYLSAVSDLSAVTEPCAAGISAAADISAITGASSQSAPPGSPSSGEYGGGSPSGAAPGAFTDWEQDFYPEALCEQLIASIQNGTPEETEKLLAAFSRNIYRDKKDTGRQEIAAICAVSGLILAARKKGPIPCGVFPDHPIEMISKIHNANTMKYYFKKEIIAPLTAWMEANSQDAQKKISQDVIRFIQNGFYTDITLEQCAKQLDCHPVYLGQLFKDQTGLTFSQYLDNYRFYMAKKWLLETGMPIAEIADRLRYSNAQNFIRSFKKKTGMTPGKYREMNRS